VLIVLGSADLEGIELADGSKDGPPDAVADGPVLGSSLETSVGTDDTVGLAVMLGSIDGDDDTVGTELAVGSEDGLLLDAAFAGFALGILLLN